MAMIDERYRVMLAAIAEAMHDLLAPDAGVSYAVVLVQQEADNQHRVGIVSDLDADDSRALFHALAQSEPTTVRIPRAPSAKPH